MAPSKTELEAMYDKAFKEFDANNYDAALKDLDAIDARQPDLAESANLRGVIQMRQKDYPNAEKALQKALAADPKFWNARFNLAEIPFLQKNWAEARKRFQELLTGNASELQGEATQLIQYKILLTYLMEGKENMVEATINKFELAPDTPAVHYANAAIALNKKDDKAAKDALTTAEKTFSPQLNKLFAESLYEVGWLEKPAGQTRAALELNSAAEKAAKTKAFAKEKFDEAEQALQQRDLTAARKLVDEADTADPNQAPVVNLRGEILLEQKDYDAAENEFKKAARIDPKYRDAQYNLALIPFKKKEYTKARDRFEALFNSTSGADKDRAAQLIKYKVYLTYLLEGKDARAQKMMEQFQFTGDTPALYYAQAAWEFKHGDANKANEWVTSARKIYSPALNGVFSDAFFDLGWLQSPGTAPATAVAEASPAETAPTIEPTPLPNIRLAQNNQAKLNDPLMQAAQANPVVPGMEATTLNANASPPASSALSASASPSVETPVASTSSPAAAKPVIANASEPEASPAIEEAVTKPTTITKAAPSVAAVAATSASPATVLAPEKVREWSEPSWLDRLSEKNTVLVGVLVLAGILLIAWVVFAEFRRRFQKGPARSTVSRSTSSNYETVEAVAGEEFVTPTRLAGGPPQISLQLRASEPALRRTVMPLGKSGRTFGNGQSNADGNGTAAAPMPAPAPTFVQPEEFSPAVSEPLFESVGEPQPIVSEPAVAFAPPTPVEEFAPAPVLTPPPTFVPEPEPVFATAEAAPAMTEEEVRVEEPVFAETETHFEAAAPTTFSEPEPMAEPVSDIEEPSEPIGQGRPIPYLAPVEAAAEPVTEIEQPAPFISRAEVATAALAGIGALRHSVENSPATSPVVSSEPMVQQPTTPVVTMPQPTPTPSPVIRTGPTSPMAGVAAQHPTAAAGGMHTAVQLTFSFEIASLQLTPSFKMSAIQLRPTSKIVSMRLAPSQNPQPAMNLQVTFEVATVQLAGNALQTIRLTPSQQQRPNITGSPSFSVAGLQLMSGEGAAPVQLTPSQQGQASVLMTAAFQIATVEFSPSFDIASIVLNSTSKNVHVQLPGAGAGAIEGAPIFEISSVQLAGNGEIGMVQVHPQGGGAAPMPRQ
ncbi:MAG: tetratricopeptide repeat protein [Chthoniobacterales bacterium]